MFKKIHFVLWNNPNHTGKVLLASVNIHTMLLSGESVSFKESKDMCNVFPFLKKENSLTWHQNTTGTPVPHSTLCLKYTAAIDCTKGKEELYGTLQSTFTLAKLSLLFYIFCIVFLLHGKLRFA